MKKRTLVIFGIIAIATIVSLIVIRSQMIAEMPELTTKQFSEMNLSNYDLNQILVSVEEDNFNYYFSINYTMIEPHNETNREMGYIYRTQTYPFAVSKEFVKNVTELEPIIKESMKSLRKTYINIMIQMQSNKKPVSYFNNLISKKWNYQQENLIAV